MLAFPRLPTKRRHADGEHATARVQPATCPKQDLDFGRYWRRHCLHLGRFHYFEEAFPVAMNKELRERDITALLDDARARARRLTSHRAYSRAIHLVGFIQTTET